MNWYEIFYWVTVADGVKGFFDVISNWFIAFSVIGLIVWIACYVASRDSTNSDKETKTSLHWSKAGRRFFIWSFTLMTVTWSAYMFCPTKKDAIMIIAGGAVGNFITSDSSSRQIPAELTLLIREKMRSEIEELKNDNVLSIDTLASKSKEELIELLKKNGK